MVARALLGVLTVLGVACAHAPASSAATGAQGAAQGAQAEKILVTGSHIPRRVDLTSSVPQTVSPVRIYSREQIDGTGRQSDLRAALRELDPSF
jgi:hypothetical protein